MKVYVLNLFVTLKQECFKNVSKKLNCSNSVAFGAEIYLEI